MNSIYLSCDPKPKSLNRSCKITPLTNNWPIFCFLMDRNHMLQDKQLLLRNLLESCRVNHLWCRHAHSVNQLRIRRANSNSQYVQPWRSFLPRTVFCLTNVKGECEIEIISASFTTGGTRRLKTKLDTAVCTILYNTSRRGAIVLGQPCTVLISPWSRLNVKHESSAQETTVPSESSRISIGSTEPSNCHHSRSISCRFPFGQVTNKSVGFRSVPKPNKTRSSWYPDLSVACWYKNSLNCVLCFPPGCWTEVRINVAPIP